jgi:hypothetical protein
MRTNLACSIAAMVVSSACAAPSPSAAFTASHAAAIVDSVRAFADTIARGITRRGPGAWRDYFADTSAFFMADEGQLVFPSGDSATRGIEGLKQMIARIDLQWGDTVRVDPLAPGLAMMATTYHELRVDPKGNRVDERGYFTGLAEHRFGGWQFRDAHWSVLAKPPAVP